MGSKLDSRIIDTFQFLRADALTSADEVDPHIEEIERLIQSDRPFDQWPENARMLIQMTETDILPSVNSFFD